MGRDCTRRGFLAGVAGACTVGAGSGAATAGAETTRATDTTGTAPETTGGDASDHSTQGTDLEAFVDEHVESALGGAADGATVAVVRDGELALSKGDGHALRSPDTPVDPGRTLFRIGSISKVVTYTAAMQLVDRGVVDPREDVNAYLDGVSVPATYDDPVTLANLTTHTAGFEMRVRGDRASHPDRLRPLDEALATHQPERVRPPGDVPIYTNYAAALAGGVVAGAAEATFADYADEHLFAPLGMTHSTFAQAPEDLVPGGSVTDAVSWYADVPPAAGMHSTATDMARFALAHLQGGALPSGVGDTADGEGRILSSEAVDAMHEQWYTPHDALPGMAFGFERQRRGDALVLSHAGETGEFSSELVLVPDRDAALFVAYHGSPLDDVHDARSSFVAAFLDRVAPTESPDSPSGRPARADELAGTYRPAHVTEHSTYEKPLVAAWLGDLTVSVADDGALVTEFQGERDRWVEVEPLVFERVDGGNTLVFRERDGAIASVFVESMPSVAFEPVGPAATLPVQTGLAAVATVVVLSGAVAWPLTAGVRRVRGAPLSAEGLRARRVSGLAATWPVAFALALLGVVLTGAVAWGPTLLNRPPPWTGVAFLVPLLGAAGTALAGRAVVRAWRRGEWHPLARLHYAAVVVASATLLWLAARWNLVWLPV